MSKPQFIYRNGVPVTVTRLDGTSYNTRMLYHRISRSKGSFEPNYSFSINYMRGGVFKPTDDIANGYLVTVDRTGEQMFLEAFSPDVSNGVNLSISAELLVANYPSVSLQRRVQSNADAYGKPATTTWNVIGTYAANVDYKQGSASYKSELLLAQAQMWVNLQKSVPIKLSDRLVIDGVNYQVDSLDYNSSIGLILCATTLDHRT